MKRPNASSITRPLGLLALTSTLILGGCDDGIQPRIWGNFPDTVMLFSLARPEFVNRPSAWDFANARAVVLEQQKDVPSVFDMAVTEDDEGRFLLLPAGLFADFDIRPGIVEVPAASLDDVTRAPRDGYTFDEPVPADTNVVYVVRSRQSPSGCFFFGKMEVLELDPTGIMTIRALTNPNCSDRSLVPNAPVQEDDGEGGGGEG
jgi:hypothetical protein